MQPFDRRKLLEMDLRVLTHIYLCLNPARTQGDFSREIGSNPVALSRMLNESKPRMKQEWIPGLISVLNRMDIAEFLEKVQYIDSMQKEVKESIFVSNTYAYIGRYIASVLYDDIDISFFDKLCEITRMGNGYVFSDKINHQWTWYFLDYDSSGSIELPNREDPFVMANAFSKIWPNFRATVFTRNAYLFTEICDCKRSSEQKYYRSAMLINEDGSIKEHMLSDTAEV